MQHFK